MSKRGANDDEEYPFTDAQLETLDKAEKDFFRIQLASERIREAKLYEGYEARRAVIKNIPGFWPTAFYNNHVLATFASIPEDKKALSFLEDVWVTRDPKEHRAFTIELYFASNPFFSDAVLKKEYKYVPPQDAEALAEDANGISKAALDFDWDRDTAPSTIKINWKEPEKALTKLHPRITDPDDDKDVESHGSFFNIFEEKDAQPEIEQLITESLFPDALEYFFGRGEYSAGDDDDEDEEEDDSDDEDIDLEKPSKKKAKN